MHGLTFENSSTELSFSWNCKYVASKLLSAFKRKPTEYKMCLYRRMLDCILTLILSFYHLQLVS